MRDLSKQQILKSNSYKMKKAGSLPRCIAGNLAEQHNYLQKLIKQVPFSSHYTTYQDYMKDKEKLCDIYCKDVDQELPDDIVEKLYQTDKELGIWW